MSTSTSREWMTTLHAGFEWNHWSAHQKRVSADTGFFLITKKPSSDARSQGVLRVVASRALFQEAMLADSFILTCIFRL